MYRADRRLYLTADKTRVVEHDDPAAAFLLVGAGCELDMATARRYGLVEAKAISAPVETKAIQAAQNKSRKRK